MFMPHSLYWMQVFCLGYLWKINIQQTRSQQLTCTGTHEQHCTVNELLYDFQSSWQASGLGLTADIGLLQFPFATGGVWGPCGISQCVTPI